jgi:beta-glucosidase
VLPFGSSDSSVAVLGADASTSVHNTGALNWQPVANGELVNPQSGKGLEDNGSGGSGTQLDIRACTDAANQQWALP